MTGKAQAPGRAPLIVAVLGGGFISGLVPAGLLPANVLNLERAYSLSHDQVGRMIALSMIFGGGVGGLIGGWLCGRIGALRNMMLAMLMGAVALGCVGLVPSYRASAGGIWGYFFAMGFMASSNVLATVMLHDRQRGLSLLHALNAGGKLAGPILGTLFLCGAWRHSFLAAAGLSLALLAPAALAHTNSDTSVGRKHDKARRAGASFWLSLAGFALIAGSEMAVALWVPAYAKQVRGFSGGQANLLLSIFLAALMLGRFGASALSAELSAKRAIAVCGACVLFAIPALMSSSYALASVFFFLFGLAFSATWPSYFSYLSHVFPEHLGLMGGAAVFATQLGFAACSWASGRLAMSNLAYPTMFGAAVMGVFVLAFFASPLARAGMTKGGHYRGRPLSSD